MEGIWNSEYLFFILEIDDKLAKDLTQEKTEGKMAIHMYIFTMEQLDPD
jgi:hypothetical protein